MTLSELYKALEMESPADLDYFEQFADLMEMDEDIPFDLFYTVLSGLDPETAGDLTENYFEDLTGAAPDEENELVSIIDSVEQNLLLLAADLDQDEARRSFAEQLHKFRGWYKEAGKVLVDGEPASIFEALTAARESALGGDAHELDLSGGLDYKLDDAAYGLGSYKAVDVVGAADTAGAEKDEDEG